MILEKKFTVQWLHLKIWFEIVGSEANISAVAGSDEFDNEIEAEMSENAAVTKSVAGKTAAGTESVVAEAAAWLRVS